MSDPTETVLIVQHQTDQAELWRAIFESQACITVIAPPQAEMIELIAQLTPDILVVDITSGLFNPFALCRDCRHHFPHLPVILTHEVGRSIESAEKRWALYQGATDMVSGIGNGQQALQIAEQIFGSVGWTEPIDSPALYTELERIGALAPPSPPVAEELPLPQEDLPEFPEAPDQPSPRNGHVTVAEPIKLQVMYRGRPLHKP